MAWHGGGTDDEVTVFQRWGQFMYQLSFQPRRQIITSLLDVPEERRLPLPDAAITRGTTVDPERYAVELRHHHLPELADVGYVRWTENSFSVERGPRFEEPAAIMRLLLDSDDQLPGPLVAGCLEDG